MIEAKQVQDAHPVRRLDLPRGPALAYRTVGNGTMPVIFIHGYSMSLESWDRVIGLLPEEFTGYAYDLRGFGRSSAAERYTLQDHLSDLLNFMDALGIERAALIGHSLGANIGQMALVAAPQKVSAFVMSNGPSRSLPHPDPDVGRVAERMRAYGTVEQNAAVLMERMKLYFDTRNVTEAELRHFVEVGACAQTEALRQTLWGLYSHPILTKDAFSGYRAPVLIIAGETDRMTPLAVARPLQEVLPQAKIITIPDCGHSPMWEKPREWADATYGFLVASTDEAAPVRSVPANGSGP